MFNQDITKHRVREDQNSPLRKREIEITTKLTKRPFMKILEKIRIKLEEQLREKIGDQFRYEINEALKDQTIEQ